ncbi:hypothetical protein K7H20_23865 [Salipiger manganoxidans]|uniref:hypothetical protein n=1 Tax=Salipiger marinus TaxID=555512 RepID=UPI001E4A3E18|nr:hypothetical protein [Salipiger manganoxidans]MCD1621077.1 hypothetical protein [Salipiger manganoxidans]
MADIQHIAKTLGQKRIADALEVQATAVNNAVTRGAFPTSWFFVIKELCDEAGIDCPLVLFKFKNLASQVEVAAPEAAE